MKIIAGKLKGLEFSSPQTEKTHPMSERMRNGLFNVLGDILELDVLDAFGGSGAISFEAISRGANGVLVLENDRSAQQIIKKNINKLGIHSQVNLIKTSVRNWLETDKSNRMFHIIICDPPYFDTRVNDVASLIARLNKNGILVYSLPATIETPIFDGVELLSEKKHSNAKLVFYRKL